MISHHSYKTKRGKSGSRTIDALKAIDVEVKPRISVGKTCDSVPLVTDDQEDTFSMTSEEYNKIIENAMKMKKEFKKKKDTRYLGIVIEKEGEEEVHKPDPKEQI